MWNEAKIFFEPSAWAAFGSAIVDGIKNGLEAAWNGLKNAVVSMGKGIKDTFASMLGIHSPSTVFATYGMQTGAGYQQGIAQSTPEVKSATSAMASEAASGVAASAPAGGGGAAGGSGRSLTIGTIENHFNISGGANAKEIRDTLSSRSFLEGFESSFKILLQSQGIPTGGPVPSGG